MEVILTVDNCIRFNIAELNQTHRPLLELIRREVALPNPEYREAVQYRRTTRGIPKEIILYEYDRKTKDLALPRGYLNRLQALLDGAGIRSKIIDARILCGEVGFKSKIQLRGYQEEAVQAALAAEQGVIETPCGGGKTAIGLELVARARVPALWLTHTKELAQQAMDRAREHLGLKAPGFIGDGKKFYNPWFTVGLVQTLIQRDLAKLAGEYGLVILDEAHRCPAVTFRGVVGQFPAYYRYGLTATPERADGLEPIMQAVIGPIVYRVTRNELVAGGYLITPRLVVVRTDINLEIPTRKICQQGQEKAVVDWGPLMDILVSHDGRNQLIAGKIAEEARAGHSCLVLSERVEHCHELQKRVHALFPGLRTAVLTSQEKRDKRARVMEEARSGETRVIFATRLADEGLDIPRLDRLFLTCPGRASGRLKQQVGRIMRPFPGKKDAAVFDFVDRPGVLRAQYNARRQVYQALGML